MARRRKVRRKAKPEDPERAHWRQITQEWNERFRIAEVEAKIDASKKTAYRITRDKGRVMGPGIKSLKAVVGPEVFDLAESLYPPQLIIRAATRIAKMRQATEARRIKRLEQYKEALQKVGMTPKQIARYRLRAIPSYKVASLNTQRINVGRGKGKYRIWPKGHREQARVVKTLQAVRTIQRWNRVQRHRAAIATHLGINMKEAAQLITMVEKQAKADLAAYKRTAEYRSKPLRQQKLYTLKRWQNASVATLFALADIEAYAEGKGRQ